jgi:hypothetical protein
MGIISDWRVIRGGLGGGSGAYWERFSAGVWRCWCGGWFGRVSGAAAGEEAVKEQKDNRSDDCYNEAAQVELEELRLAGQ